jgi:hypothetical protein
LASQASQSPSHARLQHTPWAQAPLAHSASRPHPVPLLRGPSQRPAMQRVPPSQSASVAHIVPHAASTQRYGAQVATTAAGQLPMPSQVAAAVALPSAQLAARHAVVLGG